jgi:hypothetical protein
LFGFRVWKVIYITVLVPGIFRRFLDFWEISAGLELKQLTRYSNWLHDRRIGFNFRQKQVVLMLCKESGRLWGPPNLFSAGAGGFCAL